MSSPIVFTDRAYAKQPRWRTLSFNPERGLRDPSLAQRAVGLLLACTPTVQGSPQAAARGALRAVMARLGCSAGACVEEGAPPRVLAWRLEAPASTLEVRRPLLQFTLDTGVTTALSACEGHPALACAPLGPAGQRAPGALVLIRDRDFDAGELELAALAARQLGQSLERPREAPPRRWRTAAATRRAFPAPEAAPPPRRAVPAPEAAPPPRRAVPAAPRRAVPAPEAAPAPRRAVPAAPRRAVPAPEAAPALDRTLTSTLRRVQDSPEVPGETVTSGFRRSAPSAQAPDASQADQDPAFAFTAGSETRTPGETRRARRETRVRVPLTVEVLFGGNYVLPDYLREED